ncbi:site-specific integrase [Arcanobacterium haemolyticum]|nr:site-specific integrase [Arcanobacterium haemolyticum]
MSISIDDAAHATYLNGLRRTPNAIYNAAAWGRFLETRGLDWLEATREHYSAFLGELNARGLRPSTIATYMSDIRALYQWAITCGYTNIDPTAGFKAPRRSQSSPWEWIGVDTARKVLETAQAEPDQNLRMGILLPLLVTLRRAEMWRATREDVRQLDTGMWVMRTDRAKTATIQDLAIPEDLAQDILASPTRKLLTVTPARLYQLMDDFSVRHDFPKIRPHMLRATCITVAIKADLAPSDIMTSAGHHSLALTARYDLAIASVERGISPHVYTYLTQKAA